MKKLTLLLLTFCFIAIQSCQDDIIGEGDTTEIIQEPTISVSSSVNGIVTDQSGMAMEKVEIEYNNKVYLTDQNGYFKIDNIIASEDGGILTFNKMDFFTNYKFFIPESGSTSFMRVQMIERIETGSISGASGGLLEIREGAQIEFPENAFVDENNIEYNGTVSVYAHWYNPSENGFSASMPGDLRALDAEGQLVQLSSFGMMAVELRSENGNKLNLAEGKTARLEFPIPAQLQLSAPETIETWSLDEETVYWTEESVAQVQDGKYIAEVSHFSFWNCDAPFPLVNIFGKVVDNDGNPLPHLRICIIAFNGAQTGYGWTDSEGGFRGKVPKNQDLIMQIKDECGNVVFEENIGPFGGDASFGEIIVDISGKSNVAGRLVCSGQAVSNGYALIKLSNGISYIAETDEEGFFTQVLVSCQSNEISIQGFDIENANVSETISYTISSQTDLDVGDLEVCNELDEYIIFKINGGQEVLVSDPGAAIFNDDLYINSGSDSLEVTVFMIIPDVQLGTGGTFAELQALYFEGSGQFSDFFCGSGQIPCENVVLEITALGQEGDYVEGTFMAESDNPNGAGATVMGRFRILIEQVTDTYSISGKTWIDANENGTRDSGETLLSGVRLSLTTANGVVTRTTPANGSYAFADLPPGTYNLSVFSPAGFNLTTANQGGDDSIDSDFEMQNLSIEIVDSDIENLDAGFVNSGDLICEVEILEFPDCSGEEGEAILFIEGGSNPYQIWLNNQTFGIVNQTEFPLIDLAPGFYFVRVEDDEGNVCETEFNLPNFGGLSCTVITEPASCDLQTLGSAFVEVSGNSTGLSFEWTFGERTQGIEDLPPGNYAVTVTDENGCTTICEGFVDQEFLEAFINVDFQSCENGETVSLLTIETFGGTPPYSYQWMDGSSEQVLEFTGVDFISAVVIDANGCVADVGIDIPPANSTVGDMVWIDQPGGTDNIFDPGIDSGLSGVYIELYRDFNLNSPIDSTSTNTDGLYEFNIFGNGDYRIRLYPPQNYQIVNQNAGTDDTLDSDFDPATGFSDIFTITSTCSENSDIDAGLKED